MASNFLLQEAVSSYYSIYKQNIQEDLLWEDLLTEEFVTEAYQTVADYLVYNNFVPGYQTAECYMAEMALDDIDNILFETGVLDEQYLIEAGFFQNLGAGADRFVAGARKNVSNAANVVRGTAQRAGQSVVRTGQAVAGGAQRAGQAVVGGAQRAGQAVVRAATPVAQAVQGTAQRAVAAGQSALQGAGRAAVGAGQAVVGGAQRAGQAVVGGAQRAGQAAAGAAGAVGGAASAAGRRIGQEIQISRRVGAGEPIGGTAKQQPQSQSPTTTPAPSRFGTTTPRGSSVTSTGVSGLSPTDRAAYSAGGGNAAAQRGMGQTTSQVIAQGRTNLGRMNQAVPAPAGAKPTSGGSSTNPKSGLSAYPAATTQRATSTASAASGSASPARPSAPAPISTPTTQTTATPTAKKPSLASQAAELRAMQSASRQRQGLTQSFDMFDVVMGHLLGEGYVKNEEQALAIMANMSEDWRESILAAEGMTMGELG